jgi:hypothetical protein
MSATPSVPVLDYNAQLALSQDAHQFYRIVRLNQMYYAKRLDKTKKCSQAYEVLMVVLTVLTVGSVSTLLLTDPLMETKTVLFISVLAAVGAFMKPFLPWCLNYDRYNRLYAEHTSLYYDFESLDKRMHREDCFTCSMENDLIHYKERLRNMPQDDLKPSLKTRKKLEQLVNDEIPVNTLWTPTAPATT